LIDDSNPYNQVVVKNVVIDTCFEEVSLENELLKQEVALLGKALYDKKGKAKKTQPPQDNAAVGVNKPVEGEIVVFWLYHKQGHKSYQYKAKIREKQKKRPTSKVSNTYINKVDKKAGTPYLIKKKMMAR
jgi:hypothetical protein